MGVHDAPTEADPSSYTEVRHVAYADVDGKSPIGTPERAIAPHRVTVSYDWRAQLGHGEWHVENIAVSGRFLPREGETAAPFGSGTVILGMEDAPRWARAFATANMPISRLVDPGGEVRALYDVAGDDAAAVLDDLTVRAGLVWACGSCRYRNQPGSASCEGCGAPADGEKGV